LLPPSASLPSVPGLWFNSFPFCMVPLLPLTKLSWTALKFLPGCFSGSHIPALDLPFCHLWRRPRMRDDAHLLLVSPPLPAASDVLPCPSWRGTAFIAFWCNPGVPLLVRGTRRYLVPWRATAFPSAAVFGCRAGRGGGRCRTEGCLLPTRGSRRLRQSGAFPFTLVEYWFAVLRGVCEQSCHSRYAAARCAGALPNSIADVCVARKRLLFGVILYLGCLVRLQVVDGRMTVCRTIMLACYVATPPRRPSLFLPWRQRHLYPSMVMRFERAKHLRENRRIWFTFPAWMAFAGTFAYIR